MTWMGIALAFVSILLISVLWASFYPTLSGFVVANDTTGLGAYELNIIPIIPIAGLIIWIYNDATRGSRPEIGE
jgi:hypothetical protein